MKNKFSHTLENCLLVKQELINMGKKESDFYLHDGSYSETYLHSEPMLICCD